MKYCFKPFFSLLGGTGADALGVVSASGLVYLMRSVVS